MQRHMKCTHSENHQPDKEQGVVSFTEHAAFDTLFTSLVQRKRLQIFMKAVMCLVHWRQDSLGLEKYRQRSGPHGKD